MEGLRMLQRDAMTLLDAMGRKKERGERDDVSSCCCCTNSVNVIFLSHKY
jgi:hypothetical protein